MSGVTRLSMSLEGDLLQQLDRAVDTLGASNRSEFVRSLLREHLRDEPWDHEHSAVAVLSFTYDHHAPQLNDRLVALQHDAHATVLVSTHLHLAHHLCLEMLVVRGKPAHIRALESGLRQLRGVLQVNLARIADNAVHHSTSHEIAPS